MTELYAGRARKVLGSCSHGLGSRISVLIQNLLLELQMPPAKSPLPVWGETEWVPCSLTESLTRLMMHSMH